MLETVTIEVSPQEVEQIIKEAVERRFNTPVTSVTIDIGTETRGYGFGEHDVSVLRKVVVKLGPVVKPPMEKYERGF